MRWGARMMVLALLLVVAACGAQEGRGHGRHASGPYLSGGMGYGAP
ncbi:MAG: hypothetical protein ABF479_15915 [Gluconacetobacter sp.]|uniref:Lipoprotein n=1 Tax=Gluconacetobacter dulcium TaxID=2729096 RepID=A0A7W4JYC5_9PROT|nr:hypothetical protein [Gluconacetobacter dulcium]MBB2197007.1 hypothetical protein [Gluconacetobacter dulcium]